MKKLFLVLFTAFIVNGVHAQNMKQQRDTLLHPSTTDSMDFKDKPNPEKNRDTRGSDYDRTKFRKDSLPVDDRKPRSGFGSGSDSTKRK